MKPIKLFILSAILGIVPVMKAVTLEACYTGARQNHPLLVQLGVYDEIKSLNMHNVDAANLPQIDLTGRASYQSDVTQLDVSKIPIPGFKMEEMSKDIYKVYVSVRQKIYDGGSSSVRKSLENDKNAVQKQQTEVALYQSYETVNALFFNVLSLKNNFSVLDLKMATIDERLKQLKSGRNNGMVLQSDIDRLTVDRINAVKMADEVRFAIKNSTGLLSVITGLPLDEATVFEMPQTVDESGSAKNIRPELQLFEYQKQQLFDSQKMLQLDRMPKVFLTGELGYGRPGLNMLKNEFDNWYLVGAGVSWNVFDWGVVQRKKREITLQTQLIDAQKLNFDRGILMSSQTEQTNLEKIKLAIETDKQLLEIQNRIAESSRSAFDNGTCTSADYLRDLNAALQAEISLKTDILKLQQTLAQIKIINGL